MVFTTSQPTGELKNGVVFCRVRSWLTGQRLVSLPFSDHCEPLIDSTEELELLFNYLQAYVWANNYKYLEVRPMNCNLRRGSALEDFEVSKRYYLHTVDLRPQQDELFRRFHKDSVQRRIRRAEQAGLVYEWGRSDGLLRKFYHLMLLTRRRHQIPPQPEEWFRNLVACMRDALEIRVASHKNAAVASIITFRFKDTVVYKYGCSDSAYNNLGATPFLLWKAIQKAKASGAQKFDLGRSDCDNPGLIAFKDHWASTRTLLTYWKWPAAAADLSNDSRVLKLARHLFGFLPDPLLKIAGKILYRHIG